jgi:hypothetical protein
MAKAVVKEGIETLSETSDNIGNWASKKLDKFKSLF